MSRPYQLQPGDLAIIRGLSDPDEAAYNGLIVTVVERVGQVFGISPAGKRFKHLNDGWIVSLPVVMHGRTECCVNSRRLLPIGPPGTTTTQRQQRAAPKNREVSA